MRAGPTGGSFGFQFSTYLREETHPRTAKRTPVRGGAFPFRIGRIGRIGIVLSGTGSDGSRGIREIHEAGGLVIAQDIDTAKFDGMPRSAIDTGLVHAILPPEKIPAALMQYVNQPRGIRWSTRNGPEMADPDAMQSVIHLLRQQYGIKDAPFTKMDLITCRNLLIYLNPPAQKKVLSLFLFGLKTRGLLFLGPSESPGDLASEFDTLDSQWKLYRKRRDVSLPADMRFPLSSGFISPGKRAVPGRGRAASSWCDCRGPAADLTASARSPPRPCPPGAAC